MHDIERQQRAVDQARSVEDLFLDLLCFVACLGQVHDLR